MKAVITPAASFERPSLSAALYRTMAAALRSSQRELRPRKAYVSGAEILSFHKLDLGDIMALPPTQNGNLMVPVPEG